MDKPKDCIVCPLSVKKICGTEKFINVNGGGTYRKVPDSRCRYGKGICKEILQKHSMEEM